jgi:hypothetical protein
MAGSWADARQKMKKRRVAKVQDFFMALLKIINMGNDFKYILTN